MSAGVVSLDEKLSTSRESTLFRGKGEFGDVRRILALVSTSDRPTEGWLARAENEYQYRDVLAPPWAARPLALLRRNSRTVLVLEDPGGNPLAPFLARGLGIADCLRLGVALAHCVSEVHDRGIIHRDIKPSNILIDFAADPPVASLTGFGIATRTADERTEGGSAQEIAGTLAYMAPEQTGRMNRSIDFRSDLYTVGVLLYEAVVGDLPFSSDDPLEVIHWHVARTPVSPADRTPRSGEAIPAQLSAVIMKLLAKTPENRYQTARGLEADLRHCLTHWEVSGRIPPFELAKEDIPDRPLIAEKLYGREREVAQLLSAWERAAAGGRAEVVLISGAAGVGKSTLAGELRRTVLASGGLFAAGKSQEDRRGVPYATLAEALRGVVRSILVQPEEKLESWRRALTAAFGVNGRVVAELVPEIELLVGAQPAIPDLDPRETQNRFRAVFTQFLETLRTKQPPLVLFFDDLQWVDPASLALIAHIVSHPAGSEGLRHLLFVGAYRDDEIAEDHPLSAVLPSLRSPRVATTELVLAPLGVDDLASFVAAMLRTPPERVQPLARLVHAQTGGNPFFAAQLVMALYQDGLLRLAAGSDLWVWDLDRVRAKGFTANVLDLLARTLMRLEPSERDTLKTLALLGMRANVDILARALDAPVERVRDTFARAKLTGLVFRKDDTYAFVHDRIREAAYALIPAAERAQAHLRTARLLIGHRRPDDIAEDELFALASHFSHAIASIDDRAERESVWRLEFRAAKRAKGTGAFHTARAYLRYARVLLPEDAWRTRYHDTFATMLELADCEFLVGSVDAASPLLDETLAQAASPIDRAAVQILRIRLMQVSGNLVEALATGLEALRLLGVEIPEEPRAAEAEIRTELAEIRARLVGPGVAEVLSLPDISDPAARRRAEMILDLLTEVRRAAYAVARPVHALGILKAVRFCLDNGNTPAACFAYTGYAANLASLWGDVPSAIAISSISLALNRRYHDAKRTPALEASHGAAVLYWGRPIAAWLPIVVGAFAGAINVGDFVYAAYIALGLGWLAIEVGLPLAQVRRELKPHLEFATATGNEVVRQSVRLYEQFVACLEGTTNGPSSFEDATFSEEDAVAAFRRSQYKAGLVFFHALKQIVAFLSGRYEQSLEHARAASGLRGDQFVLPIQTVGHFFHALAVAALWADAGPERRAELSAELESALPMLKLWSENCAETFSARYALVLAEKARMEGRDAEAMLLYEKAASSARDNGFVYLESLACELAGRFYLARGLHKNASAHLRDARAGYLRWGATAKVAALDRECPDLEKQTPADSSVTIGAELVALDLANVIKAAQAVSSEISLGTLTETLLRIVIGQAGADRGLLLLSRGELVTVEAEAIVMGQTIDVRLQGGPIREGQLAESVLRYVVRTHEHVVLNDGETSGAAAHLFAGDEYLRDGRPKSVLCLPLLKQSRLVGVLYLENSVASSVFTARSIAGLGVLASQAAISLENARLYEDLKAEQARLERRERALRESEERFSKAFHNGPTAMAIVTTNDWTFVEVNENFLYLFGHAREQVIGRASHEVEPWLDPLLRDVAPRLPLGAPFQNEERTVVIRSGQTKTLLVSVDQIELGRQTCVLASFGDLTERKRIEEQFHQAQKMEAIGSLAGGIAHDFNNLLTAINGYSELLLMSADIAPTLQPLIQGIRAAGGRAVALTRQLLAFSRKTRVESRVQRLNPIVAEMETMLARLIEANVKLTTRLEAADAWVDADRTQIEQILLNLVVNARDAMPKGGTLTIETSIVQHDKPSNDTMLDAPAGRYAMLTVRDTGTGMTPEVRAQVFDPFFTTKEVGKGTGLGLAVVYGILKRMSGAIEVISAPEKGTTFRIYLPNVDAPSSGGGKAGAEVARAPGADRGGETVLVVEDEDAVRGFTEQVLASQGYSVLTARNGREALDIIDRAEQALDLVMVDLVMPEMGGRELSQHIRRRRPTLPILHTSGYSTEGSGAPADSPEPDSEHFLAKPFGSVDLIQKVRAILDAAQVEKPGRR